MMGYAEARVTHLLDTLKQDLTEAWNLYFNSSLNLHDLLYTKATKHQTHQLQLLKQIPTIVSKPFSYQYI